MSRSTFTVGVLGAAATLMLAAACGNSSTTPASNVTSGAAGSATPSAPAGVLGVATTSLGPVLVDGKGFTVYMLTADTPGHSTCSAQCLKFWPLVPAPAGSGVPPVQGISAALATTKAMSGASMVTAGGWPLYTFVKDQAPGNVAGEGVKAFGGTWYVVSPSGKAMTAPAKTAPAKTAPAKNAPTTTTTSGGGGYGY
jgi:predicted lipoprotein with Yx(FWY)xxD motif